MNIVQFVIKDVFRKKIRILLTILGVAVGICVCIIMLGVGESIKNSFKDTYGKRQIDLVIEEEEQPSILLSRIPSDIGSKIKDLIAIADSSVTLLHINKINKSAVPVFGWEAGSSLFDDVQMLEGRKPELNKKEAIVGESLSRSLKKENQSQLKIKGTIFNVVGTYRSSSPYEQFAAVLPLQDLQAAIRQEGKASFINIKLKAESRTDEAIEKLSKEIESRFPFTTVLRSDAFIAEKTKFIVVGEQFSLLISIITVIAVALGLANTMVASTFEKRKILAILLALGWQKIEIAVLFVCESLVVAGLGGLIGIFLGFKGTAYVFGMTSIQAFVPQLDFALVCKIVVMILGSSVFAALVPTWITLNSNPVEVIRGE